MATPVIATDGTDFVEADVVNQYIAGPGGGKKEVKMHWAHIQETGAAFEVDSAVDSGGIVTGDLAFNGGNTSCEITIAGFSSAPVVTVSPAAQNSAYEPFIFAVTNVLIDIRFRDIDTGAVIVTGVIDSNMDFNLIAIGF